MSGSYDLVVTSGKKFSRRAVMRSEFKIVVSRPDGGVLIRDGGLRILGESADGRLYWVEFSKAFTEAVAGRLADNASGQS